MISGRAIASRISGSSRSAFTSRFSNATMSCGVPAGARMPYHVTALKPLYVSATVGTLGKTGERFVDVTASTRTRPAAACPWMLGTDDM